MEAIDLRPVLLAWAQVQAETMGAKKCNKKGVGPLLRKLQEQSGCGVPTIYGCSAKRAATLLGEHCRLCGKCARA